MKRASGMAKRGILLVGDPPLAAVCRDYFTQIQHGGGYEAVAIEYCDDALMLLRCQPFDLMSAV
jgi:hypothetical protein